MSRARMVIAAVGIAGSLALGAAPVHAANIAVDVGDDTVANNDGHCTLREAVSAANTDTASGVVAGECGAGSGADVITLPARGYDMGRIGSDDNNAAGDFDITSAVTIAGAGANVTTIDGNTIDRVFDVLAGGVVTIRGVTVTGGHAATGTTGATHSPGSGDRGGNGGNGGGIRNAGTLTVEDSVIAQNLAGTGGNGGNGFGTAGTTGAAPTTGGDAFGGDGGNGGDGGGIYTDGALTLTRVTVSGNVAGPGGHGGNGTGGQGGTGTAGDSADGGVGRAGLGGTGGRGGGIGSPNAGTVTIDQSRISGNTAGAGTTGGTGMGGLGGPNAVDGAHAGDGGLGFGAVGGFGGRGGGMYVIGALAVTASLIEGNTGGAGAPGNAGTGGVGGASSGTGGFGGKGGFAFGGQGGAGGDGGGIYAGNATLVNDTLDGNTSGSGAPGSTGTGGKGGNALGTGGNGGNAIGGNGGTGGGGGGVHLLGQVTMRHVTITSNSVGAGAAPGATVGGQAGSPNGVAGGPGGNTSPGLGGTGGAADGSAHLTLVNTLVAGNATPSCTAISPVDGGHNFVFPDSTCPGVVADPLLGPLADNGGSTRTRALLAGSPAIDVVPTTGAGCSAADQRGVVRPQGTACDSGAFEVEQAQAGTSGGPGPGADVTPPVFVAASMKPSTFAVDRRGAAETAVAARRRAKKGTKFRYQLSEPARVLFTIQRQAKGRRVKGKCVKPRRANRRKKKCARFVRVGRFAAAGKAGANVKPFSGKVGRKALKRGRYRAVLVAIDAAGNKSAPRRLRFRVVRR